MLFYTNFEKVTIAKTSMYLSQFDNQFSSFHACTNDSSEIMKGTLVWIQKSSSPLPSVTSSYPPVPVSNRLPLRTRTGVSPQTKTPKRLLVVVKVYRQNSKHFAIVNFMSRYQFSLPPVFLNLAKYHVQHEARSKTITLYSVAREGTCLTFEATDHTKACEWAQAFGGQGQGRDNVNKNILRDNHGDGLESISEESSDDESSETTTITTTTTTTTTATSTLKYNRSTYIPMPPIGHSRNSLTKIARSSSPSRGFGVSRRPLLPVLSESEETDEEMSADSDSDCVGSPRLD